MSKKVYDIERNISFSILSEAQKMEINQGALEILETIGMKISGERMLKKLAEKELYPDENGIVYFPRSIVKWALSVVPKEVVLYGVDGEPRIFLDNTNRVYFGTHANQLEYLDYKTNQARPFLKGDTAVMCKLANALENIDFIYSVGLSSDVPARVQSQVDFIETLKQSQKTVLFSSNDIASVQECIDIAAIAAGGIDNLKAKPFVCHYCEPIPPLTHPVESTEKLYICAENRLPVIYMPYCMMGGTAPMDRATTLAQCFSEILAGIVMTQLVSEGTPFIIGAMPSIIDMRTTVGSYAAPEFHMMIAASSEMADYYGLPFYGTASTSDAKTIDEQSMGEISYELLSTMLSKANLIHDIGLLDHCVNVSPAAVVFANEIINMLKSYNRGVDDHVDLDLIREAGHGKHYLTAENTVIRCKEVWYPKHFSRDMTNPDKSNIMEKIVAHIDEIMAQEQVSPLPKEILAKLEELQKQYLESSI